MNIIDRSEYINKIINLLGKNEIIVLTGQRRVGKSCILESLSKRLSSKGNIIYLDKEDPDNALINDYQSLNQYIKDNLSQTLHNYLFIDEVQEIRDFEKTLRFYSKQDNIDVIVTGSNAAMLSSEIATMFAGRYIRVHIFGLDYIEFLQFYGLEDSDTALSQYLRWGGMPFLSNIPLDDVRSRNDYLNSIYDTIFVKDIVSRRQIRNIRFLNNLIRFIADNSGKLFSSSSIAKYMKGIGDEISSNTVADYMDAICNTYCLDRISRFDIKGKRIFEQQDKYYFEDIGLRNILCSDRRGNDIEKIMETAVYLHLLRSSYTVYIGQYDGKEIDFVAKRGEQLCYYQVTMKITSAETYQREIGNLLMIKDNYPKYIITLDPMSALVANSGIVVRPLREFLLDKTL